MTCEECDKITNTVGHRVALYDVGIAYYRIGNNEIGYANIGLIGCPAHIKLALDKLNQK